MKVMNRIFKLALLVVVGSIFVGCYNDYDNPGPAKVYTRADLEAEGLTFWSIKKVKDRYKEANPSANDGTVASYEITEPVFTMGKVISSDYTGNVYKTVYIYDQTSETAIELRLNTDNFLFYPVGQMVLVRLQGLTLGNYRGMISIGAHSGDSKYANANIVDKILEAKHILSGAQVGMTKADTLVVTPATYPTLTDDALARLIRFEGVTSKFGTAGWGYKNSFPNYFANSTSYDVNSKGELWKKVFENGPTWALKAPNPDAKPGEYAEDTFFFGSAWFTYGDVNNTPGNYVVRSSGYCSFREGKMPADGKVVDITAIYTKFTSGSGGNAAYQLLLNRESDVKVLP